MLVRIAKRDVRKGMFIEAVECESRLFGRRRFLLNTDGLLSEIMATPADYVLVNARLSQSSMTGRISGKKCAPRLTNHLYGEVEKAISRITLSLGDAVGNIGRGVFEPDNLETLSDDVRTVVDYSPIAFYHVTRLQSYDDATYQHSLAVGGFMMKVGETLGLEDQLVQQLGVAGLLHDVGKLLMPAEVLNKAGRLSDQEKLIIRTHPEKGYRILRRSSLFSPIILDITRYHHELLNGSGYPEGLAGVQISLPVRIATVCDVFDALTSVRPYKRAWPLTDAIKWLFEHPELFDVKIVLKLAAFL